MTDIVERLKDGGVFPMTFGGPDVKDVVILYDPMTPTDAIKEIERLRAALLEIVATSEKVWNEDLVDDLVAEAWRSAALIARRALEGKQEPIA